MQFGVKKDLTRQLMQVFFYSAKVRLSVPDIHEAQNHSLFTFCLIFFYQTLMYQKSERHFFDQGSIDVKSEVKVKILYFQFT